MVLASPPQRGCPSFAVPQEIHVLIQYSICYEYQSLSSSTQSDTAPRELGSCTQTSSCITKSTFGEYGGARFLLSCRPRADLDFPSNTSSTTTLAILKKWELLQKHTKAYQRDL